ncbi:aminoglycoside phosphotransferase family protein [Nocardia cyriacigeorgica]|uniref:phosphotransferase enzyme family protein n=1 Tax=Nocardia cyriacigeorgica TaxID=135487 RepID=UPI001893F1DE|nr:aminoglycoside phosphotransferase family protein [Nocardia cyriacigeorgica]MBF6397850.1 aminoglycoside phosphotransferase family protein [Nocardia cyriacigeorgica]MBF6402493.1 aminoglycoside phosphotransferase family protein [Nocardia cyriacigeorgica]
MLGSQRPFTPSMIRTVVRAACLEIGLPSEDLTFMRLGQNLLYHLPASGVVVRVARGPSYESEACKEVAVAKWLGDHGFPAAKIFDIGRPQPIDVSGFPITFWHYISGRPATADEAGVVGDLLRRLHRLPAPADIDLPEFRPFDRIQDRLSTAPISDSDKSFLAEREGALRAEVASLDYNLPCGVNHGDAHIMNVMISSEGEAELIDFEAFNFAPHDWDLAKTATEADMGMLPGRSYTEFARAYGYDVTRWRGFDVLRSVMQLRMTTWLAQNVDHSEGVAREYEKRIRTLRFGFTESWSGF